MFNIWPFNILRKRREAAAKRRDEIAQRAFEDVERQRQARRAQEVLDTHRRMNQRLRATPVPPPPFPPRPTRPTPAMARVAPSREQYNPARSDNMDDNLLLAAVLMQQNAVTPQYDEPRHRSDPEPCRSYSSPDSESSRSSDSGSSSYSCDSGSSSSSDSGSSPSSGGGFD